MRPAARTQAAPPFRWRSGRGRRRPLHGSLGAERRRRARTGAAGSRDWSEPGRGWTGERRRPPCASAPRGEEGQRSSSSRSSAATPAASDSSRASRASAVRRSDELIPRSLSESSGMLSCRGSTDGGVGDGWRLIMLLLDDGGIARGVSSETALDQQVMKVSQRRYAQARRAERHYGARRRIEYPRRHHHDHAGRHLDVDELTAGAPLRVLAANTPPMKRVPSVTNFDFLPDMGRMTAQWPSGAGTGPSPARTKGLHTAHLVIPLNLKEIFLVIVRRRPS